MTSYFVIYGVAIIPFVMKMSETNDNDNELHLFDHEKYINIFILDILFTIVVIIDYRYLLFAQEFLIDYAD